MNRIIPTIIAVVLLASACGTDRPEAGTLTQPDDRPSLAFVDETGEESESSVSANTLFEFSADELFTGQTVEGLDLVQEGPMLVSFVDPTCPVCLSEAPILGDWSFDHPDVTFVVVHGFSSVDQYLEYTDIGNLHAENTVHIVDPTGALWNRYGILSQPATLVVDEAGGVTLTEGALGDVGYEEILTAIDS